MGSFLTWARFSDLEPKQWISWISLYIFWESTRTKAMMFFHFHLMILWLPYVLLVNSYTLLYKAWLNTVRVCSSVVKILELNARNFSEVSDSLWKNVTVEWRMVAYSFLCILQILTISDIIPSHIADFLFNFNLREFKVNLIYCIIDCRYKLSFELQNDFQN